MLDYLGSRVSSRRLASTKFCCPASRRRGFDSGASAKAYPSPDATWQAVASVAAELGVQLGDNGLAG